MCRLLVSIAVICGLAGGSAWAQSPSMAAAAHRTPSRPKGGKGMSAKAETPLTDEERAMQMLNRFTFGARPGDLAVVMQMGPDAWFEQQLEPEKIPDSVLDKRLGDFPGVRMPLDLLLADFPTTPLVRQIAEGKHPMPTDPTIAAVYQVLIEKYERQQAEQKAANSTTPSRTGGAPMATAAMTVSVAAAKAPAGMESGASSIAGGGMQDGMMAANAPATRLPAATGMTAGQSAGTGAGMQSAMQSATTPPTQSQSAASQADAQKAAQKKLDQAQAALLAEQLLGLPKPQRMSAILKMPVDQRIVLTANVADPQKSLLMADFNPREREIFTEMAGNGDAAFVLDSELEQAKLVRTILSERQLQEVMTDFWFNHFNVFVKKDSDQISTAGYERDAIRPHALGKFRDLLLATAQHPAMLVYLDNWQSIGPDSPAAGKPKPGQKAPQRGLNENYGREVMELHTVGVNGGYTQADVTNLAKILTGWTVDHPELGGGFSFDPKKHEPGPKKWFARTIQENGYNEGKEALVWLAAQPQTAHFISYKLAQRFVADQPPAALVDRMAATFLSSDGDIKEVLRTMVHSPEFNSRKYYRNKVKTPLEFVASSLRATETNPTNPSALAGVLRNMGEPLYQCLPPTGYSMTADAWMNSGALVDRLNFSLSLANSKLGNIKFDAPHLLAAGLLSRPGAVAGTAAGLHTAAMIQSSGNSSNTAASSGAEEALRLMEVTLIGGQVSAKTNGVIQDQMSTDLKATPPVDPAQTLDTMTALILGSPEFQMR